MSNIGMTIKLAAARRRAARSVNVRAETFTYANTFIDKLIFIRIKNYVTFYKFRQFVKSDIVLMQMTYFI